MRSRKMFSRNVTSFISWKNIIFLLALASLVQTVNLSLSWLIHQKENNMRKKNFGYLKETHFHEDILNKVLDSSIIDSSGEFRFVLNVIEGLNIPKISNSLRESKVLGVTLVTQCSLSQLHHMVNLSKIWQGPISVAILLQRHELGMGIKYFMELKKCFMSIDSNVTFSVVFPLKSDSSQSSLNLGGETSCNLLPTVSFSKNANYEQQESPYPNNLLRNVARKSSSTSYSLILDIDMVPSLKLPQAFIKFVQSSDFDSSEKAVWVLPAYEIKQGIQAPLNKSNLLALRKNFAARPFYQELCAKCQKFTDYDVWENTEATDPSYLRPVYEVLWRDPWEPFFISGTEMPLHDERFQQYGFNRISQVCELHVAGYRFQVLNSGFVSHLGFKKEGSLHTSKESEQEKNRLLYRQFKADLKTKYPHSSRRCY